MNQHLSERLYVSPYRMPIPDGPMDVDVDMDRDADDGSSNGSAAADEVFSPRGPGTNDADSDGDMDGPADGAGEAYAAAAAAADDDDAESIASDSSFRSLVSLTESVYCSREEHGRFYHAYYSGDYMFPDDPKHQWFLEALHQTYYYASGSRLHYCPGPEGPHRVLDLGTGPGSWAIDYASVHPEAQVIGVDISPVQPSLVPENCSFEVDHLEQAWTWSQPFDLIYWRFLHGCFADVPAMVHKCFANLRPGGFLEIFDGLTLRIDPPAAAAAAGNGSSSSSSSALVRLVALATDASARRGRPLDRADAYPRLLRAAGFADVVHAEVLWPVNGRASEPGLGHYVSYAFGCDLEGLFLALLCRDGPLSFEAAAALCEAARQELREAPMNAFWVFHMTYGRKPTKGGH